MRSHVWCWSLALSLGAHSLAAAQRDTVAAYRQGQITFTHGGKQVTWTLQQGRMDGPQGKERMFIARFTFTPDGKPERGGSPVLRLAVMKMGDMVNIDRLSIDHGPGGSAVYRSGRARCKLAAMRLAKASAEVTGTCTGEFEGGPGGQQVSLHRRAMSRIA